MHDDYYLLCPSVLFTPRRWTEVYPFDGDLSKDERYNAAARLTLLSTASAAILTESPFRSAAGGVLALALLHWHREATAPGPPDELPTAVESKNPLPMAERVVAPRREDASLAVDAAFGARNRRGEVQLVSGQEHVMPDRKQLFALERDGTGARSLEEDEPMNRSRLFARQVDRRNFRVVSHMQGAPEV